MSDNTVLNTMTGGDTVRDIDRGSGIKTQVTQIDVGGASGNAESLLTRGQQASAASLPVVVASDQSALTVTQAVASASGSITTQNTVPAGTATTNSAVAITLSGAVSLAIQVTGTFTGALSLQATLDGATWVTLGGVALINVNTGANLAAIASGVAGIYQADVGAFLQARLTALAAVTGTAVVTLRAASNPSMMALDASLPAGANNIGNVGSIVNALPSGANQIGAVTLASGTQNVGGVSQKVVSTSPLATLGKIESAATTNSTSVKTSAGNLFQWQLTNNAAYPVWVKFYNKASAPTVGTDATFFKVQIPAGGIATMPHGCGIQFSLGIGYGITKALIDSDTTAVALGDVVGHFLFA